MWLMVGAVLAAIAVMAGAFGAHGLAQRVDSRGLELWDTGSRYLFYGAVGLCLLGIAQRAQAVRADGAAAFAGWALLLGVAIFSGTLFAMALGGPRWFGAITPIGGVLLIAGFLAFAAAAR